MKNLFLKYDSLLYFVVAILSLIASWVRHSPIWLVLCFGCLSMGFYHMAIRKKNRRK